jgi:hypothetical protein
MIVTEKVLIEVNNKNIHIFRKKLGCDIEIGLNEISVRDLSKGSHFKVEVKCDSCEVINNIEWRAYLKFTKDETDIYCCKKCNNVKVRKTNLERYGVVCNSQLESNKKKVKEKSHSSNIKRIDTLEKKYGEFYFDVISEKRKQHYQENKEEIIWCCEYCDKEFVDEKNCDYHIQNCKYNNEDDESEDDDDDDNDVVCFRCGREGHYATDCYASKHINGKYLS